MCADNGQVGQRKEDSTDLRVFLSSKGLTLLKSHQNQIRGGHSQQTMERGGRYRGMRQHCEQSNPTGELRTYEGNCHQ